MSVENVHLQNIVRELQHIDLRDSLEFLQARGYHFYRSLFYVATAIPVLSFQSNFRSTFDS